MSFLKNTTESVTTDLSTSFDPIPQLPEEYQVPIPAVFKNFILHKGSPKCQFLDHSDQDRP